MITKRELILLISLLTLLFGINATLDIMDIDAAQYAQMSLELMHSKNCLQLFCLHQNYLDKPPLLFWLSAMSFKIFGVYNWSYKLPSILFAVLGLLSTYRLGARLVDARVGIYSAIILATTFAFFQLTHDIRTDTILMGAVIFSSWQLYDFFLFQKTKNVFGAGIGISLALLAKGPIGLIIPFCFFFVFTVLYERKTKKLFSIKLLWLPLIIFMMLLPMCIGLFQQYGWHGINFFFWYQSFGRITGENTWKNNPDRFFLLHTTLWAFLPWTLLFIYAMGRELKALFTYKSTIAGVSIAFLLTLLALSLSKYQLPHYVFVAYPFLAIVCATYAEDFFASKLKYVQAVIVLLAVVCGVILNFYCFPSSHTILLSFLAVVAIIGFFYTKKIVSTALPITLVLISLAIGFQTELLKYQSFNEVGRFLKTQKTSKNEIVNFNCKFSFAFYFYSQDYTKFYTTIEELLAERQRGKELLVYTSAYGYDLIKQSELGAKTSCLFSRESYEVTRLKPAFINPEKRSKVVEKYYLLKILL